MKSISEVNCCAYGRRLPIDFFCVDYENCQLIVYLRLCRVLGLEAVEIGMASFERSLLCCHDVCRYVLFLRPTVPFWRR